MLYPRRVVIGVMTLAIAAGSLAVANGDVLRDQDRLQERLKDGSCLLAADQTRDRIRDCDEVCIPDGDGIPDQIRLRLHDCL
ncbi:MAG: hypothetical protein CVT59_03955 [Actinobacteria bacterium HGW-Actinobacteria-1]|jgi:hypothetical protein|nr:MAG: hypothetical protein CVT59_03955 [Actinobacteria bacterium HGW-Actinobacteria-1]